METSGLFYIDFNCPACGFTFGCKECASSIFMKVLQTESKKLHCVGCGEPTTVVEIRSAATADEYDVGSSEASGATLQVGGSGKLSSQLHFSARNKQHQSKTLKSTTAKDLTVTNFTHTDKREQKKESVQVLKSANEGRLTRSRVRATGQSEKEENTLLEKSSESQQFISEIVEAPFHNKDEKILVGNSKCRTRRSSSSSRSCAVKRSRSHSRAASSDGRRKGCRRATSEGPKRKRKRDDSVVSLGRRSLPRSTKNFPASRRCNGVRRSSRNQFNEVNYFDGYDSFDDDN